MKSEEILGIMNIKTIPQVNKYYAKLMKDLHSIQLKAMKGQEISLLDIAEITAIWGIFDLVQKKEKEITDSLKENS